MNIGTSTNLYFATFKNLSFLLIILTIIYSIFAIVTNVVAAHNTTISDTKIDYLTISLSSKMLNDTADNRNYYFAQCCIGALTLFLWLLVFIEIKYSEIK